MTFVVVCCGFLIGLAKSGFAGFAMLNTPLLAWAGGASFAVGATLPMLLVGDVMVGWRFFGQWDKRTVLTMVPGAFLGVCLGTPLLARLSESEHVFNRVMGLVAIVFAVGQWVFEARRDPLAEHRPAPVWVGLLAGAGTGVVSTIAHQGGLVSNLYMLSQRLTKQRFAATAMGVYFSLNTMKLVPYLAQGRIDPHTLHYSLLGAPAVVLGVLLGAKLIERMDPRHFTRLILILVVLTGLKLLLFP